MPRYRNKENGQEMDATTEFASVALPESLYEIVEDETYDERVQRELREARDAKVEPPDAENDSTPPAPDVPVGPQAGAVQNGDVR